MGYNWKPIIHICHSSLKIRFSDSKWSMEPRCRVCFSLFTWLKYWNWSFFPLLFFHWLGDIFNVFFFIIRTNCLSERRISHSIPSLTLSSSPLIGCQQVSKSSLGAVGCCSQPMRKEQLLHSFTPLCRAASAAASQSGFWSQTSRFLRTLSQSST